MVNMKKLTEKQLHNRLNKYYKKHFGECDTDEWFNNPAENKWKFMRGEKVIVLTCDVYTGEVEEKKYRLKDTYSEDFWDEVLKSPSFQNFVKKRFQLGATGSPAEASDEDMYNDEEE